MNLYLVRHGETEWNRLKKFQGQQDSQLTDIGIKQAKSLGKYLKMNNINIDVIYSSPSKRALDTANLLDINLEIVKDKRLMEMGFGTWEGKTIDIIKKNESENFFKLFHKTEEYSHKPHNAESFFQVENRIKEFLEDIRIKNKFKNVLIVSHGMTLKILLKFIKNESLEDFPKNEGLFNTSLSLIKYNNSWNIEFLSKLEHLDENLVTQWTTK